MLASNSSRKLESHLAIFGNPDCTKRQCALKQKVVSRLAAIGVLEDAAAGFCERICALATSLGADFASLLRGSGFGAVAEAPQAVVNPQLGQFLLRAVL
jgi:hypothetical protein